MSHRVRFNWTLIGWSSLYLLASSVTAEEPATAFLAEPPLTAADREHWSFRPLLRPALPEVQRADWPRNEIDRFILARLEQKGLTPLPPADRFTLLRRVSFDLTGLPPSPDEIERFAGDDSPEAYERLLDRLLASPAYGERWAQHWLDLARFAETDGFEHDKPRPDAWRYRDWVIESLNADLPYDEFVRLQLAADELRPADERAAQATGFLLCGPDMPDLNLQDERRHNVLGEMTATVGSVFLGLQLGCAQCHDHKFDPLSQADFYRLQAVLSPGLSFEESELGRVLRESSASPPPSYLMVRGDFRRPGPEAPPAFPRIANPWDEPVPAPPPGAATSGRRTALARWLTRPDHPLATRVIVNRLWQQHFGQGLVHTPSDFGTMGDTPSHSDLLDWLATELPRQGWSLKRMHKLLLLSATYRQSSHPAELRLRQDSPDGSAEDWQAALDRWRRSRQLDPENRLLARMNRQRLAGESLRDAMLFSGGRLSSRRGGPGVRPPLPTELLATAGGDRWPASPEVEDQCRRSIYVFVRRTLRYPLFEAFDSPDTIASCPLRNRSTTAPQALWLMNSEFSLEAARCLAGSLLADAPSTVSRSAGTEGDPAPLVRSAYLRTLCRPPDADESAAALAFLRQQAEMIAASGRPANELALPAPLPDGAPLFELAALVDFCLALFNLNEFVYVE